MKLQKTIKNEVKISGKGLFGGKEAKVVFCSAPANSGIVFVRTDVPEAVRINAVVPNVAERSRRTTLKKGSVSIETVEHCLAAVWALGIDNLTIEVNSPELPAPDCSSASYFRVLKEAELLEQIQAAEYLRSVVAAAGELDGIEHDALRAQVDAKIAADPSWAVQMRPQVVALRALNGEELTTSLKKFVEDIQQD